METIRYADQAKAKNRSPMPFVNRLDLTNTCPSHKMNIYSFHEVMKAVRGCKRNMELSQATRQRIHAAALMLFAKQGCHVTIAHIAKEAGVSQGLLYRHYASKELLIAALVRQAKDQAHEFVEEIVRRPISARERIEQLSMAMFNLLLGQEGAYNFLLVVQVSMNADPSPEIAAALASGNAPVRLLQEVIVQGQRESSIRAGEPGQLAVLYWAAIQGLCCFALSGILTISSPHLLSDILLREETQWHA